MTEHAPSPPAAPAHTPFAATHTPQRKASEDVDNDDDTAGARAL